MSANEAQASSYPRTLREARRARRISQVRLAERMGCRQNYISDLERGARRPGPMFKAFAAEVLRYPPEVVESWFAEVGERAA
jgi:transcriptional regulator with XRE-family HTH domain